MFFGSTAPGPSARAKVPMISPEATFGSRRFFCSSVPADQQRFGEEIDGGRERHRRERAAHFLRDDAELEIAEAEAAELFRDRGADPAHLRDLLPQRGVVCPRALDRRLRTVLVVHFSLRNLRA